MRLLECRERQDRNPREKFSLRVVLKVWGRGGKPRVPREPREPREPRDPREAREARDPHGGGDQNGGGYPNGWLKEGTYPKLNGWEGVTRTHTMLS